MPHIFILFQLYTEILKLIILRFSDIFENLIILFEI
jgi:hypothetical protein